MRGLGEREALVTDRLWSGKEPRTVRAVYEDLRQHRQIAHTTVMTVMDNLPDLVGEDGHAAGPGRSSLRLQDGVGAA